MSKANAYPFYLALPAFLLFMIFFILPNIAGLFMSFTDWSAFHPLRPAFNGLENFKDLFESSIFKTSIFNTVYFAFVTTAAKIVFGFGFAVLLHNRLRLKTLYRTLIFAPVVINPIVVAIIFKALYEDTNGPINAGLRFIGLDVLAMSWLTDSRIAMLSISGMDIWMGVGVTMVIFLAGLQSVPQEYYEAATIDGAGAWQQFLRLTIPLTGYALMINTMLSLINGTKVFAQVYGLTNGGPADATQVYGTFMFKSFGAGLFGYSAAAGLLFTVIISAFSLLLLRLFRKTEVEYG